jgi:hypothetical protein
VKCRGKNGIVVGRTRGTTLDGALALERRAGKRDKCVGHGLQ